MTYDPASYFFAVLAVMMAAFVLSYVKANASLKIQLTDAENAKAKAEREAIGAKLLLDAHKANSDRPLKLVRSQLGYWQKAYTTILAKYIRYASRDNKGRFTGGR